MCVMIYLQKSADKVMQEIYKKHISNQESSLPHSSLEGLRKICWNEKHAWMIAPINVLSYTEQLDCQVEAIPNAFIPGCASMAIQKRSPYRAILRYT